MKKIKVLSLSLAASLMINTVSMTVFAGETAFTATESEQEFLIETEQEEELSVETESLPETDVEETVVTSETEADIEIETETEIETEVETETETETETEVETEEEKDEFDLQATLGNVTNLKAVSAGKRAVRLNWNSVYRADGYLIYAQKNGRYGYAGMTQGTTFTDTRALDSDYNFYWVFPYVTGSNGKMIPGSCTKYVFAKGVCPAVTNLRAASVTNAVRLTWSRANGADGYLVYGMNGADRNYHYIGMTTGEIAFTDTKASKTQWNYYWVFPFHYHTSYKMMVGGAAKYVYGKAKAALYTVTFEEKYTSSYYQYGKFTARDAWGNVMWTRTSQYSYPATQLSAVSEIGQRGTSYYYAEGGTIYALDTQTGNIRWSNTDFVNYGAKGLIASNGRIFVSGIFGPALVVLSPNGETLKRIEDFNGYCRVTGTMGFRGDTLIINYASDTMDMPGGLYTKCRININTLTYTLETTVR